MSGSSNMLSMHDRIFRRTGHVAVTYKHYCLVWGGYMETPTYDVDGVAFNFQEYHYTDEVWALNCNTEVWERWLTSGDNPPSLCGASGLVLGTSLYVFAGYCGAENMHVGSVNWLHRLDLTTLVWQRLLPGGQTPAPCDKLAGWTYNGKLYFFGGFGPTPTFRPSFSHVVDITTNYGGGALGWNNQLVVYNPASHEWEWPSVRGVAPSPRAAHDADITGHRAFIFGGRFKDIRTNDLFFLDLEKMQWSDNLTDSMERTPEGRSWHSFTFVSPERAVVYGGFNTRNQVLNDCWELNVDRLTWHPVKRTLPPKGRYYHSSSFSQQALLTFGGCSSRDQAEEMLTLDFSPKSLFRLSMDTVLTKVPRAQWMGEPNGVSCLPKTLEVILRSRFEQAHMLPALSISDQLHQS